MTDGFTYPTRIIFTGSWVQEVPWPDIAAYATSKAGLRQLARCMAFLCGEAASSMTGAVLLVDGGCSLFQFDALQRSSTGT